MFGGGPHQQDVVAAAFPPAAPPPTDPPPTTPQRPPSTEDALAIVPQDLEAVTHRHRNLCRSLSGEGYHHAAARQRLRPYIRSHGSNDHIRIHLGDRGAILRRFDVERTLPHFSSTPRINERQQLVMALDAIIRG